MSDHTPDGTGNGSSRPVGSARVHGVLDVAAHVGEVEVALEAVERALHSFVSILMHDSEDLQKQRRGRQDVRPTIKRDQTVCDCPRRTACACCDLIPHGNQGWMADLVPSKARHVVEVRRGDG